MKYRVTLCEPKSHKTVVVEENYGTTPKTIEFQWREGNFSCDCNRWPYFEKDGPCGDTIVLREIYVEGSGIIFTDNVQPTKVS